MSLRSLLVKARAFIAAIAPVTPLKTDDELPGLIDALLADAALFGWFEDKVAASDSGVLSIESTPPVALQMVLEQRKVNWSRLIELLPAIIQVISVLKG